MKLAYFSLLNSYVWTVLVKQLTYEESREADSSTRQATHKVSKGLYNKVFLYGLVLYFSLDYIVMGQNGFNKYIFPFLLFF